MRPPKRVSRRQHHILQALSYHGNSHFVDRCFAFAEISFRDNDYGPISRGKKGPGYSRLLEIICPMQFTVRCGIRSHLLPYCRDNCIVNDHERRGGVVFIVGYFYRDCQEKTMVMDLPHSILKKEYIRNRSSYRNCWHCQHRVKPR